MSILAARLRGVSGASSGDLRRIVALGRPARPWAIALPSVARIHGRRTYAVVATAFTLVGALGAVMLVVAIHSHVAGDALGLLRADPMHPYVGAVLGEEGAYLWSPAIVQAAALLRDAPWFVDGLRAVNAGALVLMAGPASLPVLAFGPTIAELRLANINILIGAAVVLGLRWPAAWAFVLLTKVTPGVGLVWFAVRREWRSLGIALAVTAAVAAVSFAISPEAWVDWFRMLAATRELGAERVVLPFPLALRVLVAAGLVAWGARRDHRWTLPVAAFVALPAAYETALPMLVAVFPLLSNRMVERSSRSMRKARVPFGRRRSPTSPPRSDVAAPATGVPG
jgi:Glycosyltransferase family 87